MSPKEIWEAYSNHTVRQSVHPNVRHAFCLVHISFESQIDKWMYLGMTECSVPLSGHCDLDLRHSF